MLMDFKIFLLSLQPNMNEMDKRKLEIILIDQQEELDTKRSLHFCQRKEEDLIDLNSPQAQVVIRKNIYNSLVDTNEI